MKYFEGKNESSDEILDYNRFQRWYIKAELSRANKVKFSDNEKMFFENLKKINLLEQN